MLLPAKAQALLAYLAVRPGQAHPRDKLAALLWGGTSEAQARSNLRHALFDIRRAVRGVSPGALVAEAQTIALDPAALDVDVLTLERLVADGTAEALERAAALYQGDLLEGLSVNEPPFEEWLLAERERIRELAVEALARLVAHQSESQATERAIRTAIRLLALDPLQEAAHRALMRLYARQGRRGAALRQYQVCVDLMQRELGVEPEPETRQLYQEILKRPSRQPAKRVASTPQVEPPRRATPLIGRDAEIARFRDTLSDVVQGHARGLLVLGETGIGKSRLLDEITADAITRDGRVLTGRCYESERILPFGPWVDALRAMPVALSPDLLDRLAPVWRAELLRLLPELDPREPGAQGGGENHLQLFDAVAELLALLAADGLLIVVIEDLHWADEMSVRLLGYLARRLVTPPILFLATARSEELPESPVLRQVLEELEAETRMTTLTLVPLSRRHTEALVEVCAPRGIDGAQVARLARQVWGLSEGNPFVIVETMRALGDGDAAVTPTALGLPDRVREVITARLARLSPPAEELLAVAAVIGREFEFALLQHAAGLTSAGAAAALEELVRRRALQGVGERFEFIHERVREVTYGKLLTVRRRLLHATVAETIETIYAGELDIHYAALASHYREAQVWDKAAIFLRQVGVQAASRWAYRDAATLFRLGLAAIEHLPRARKTLEQAIELRLCLRNALVPLGHDPEVLAVLDEAKALAESIGDEARLGRILVGIVNEHDLDGRTEAAFEAARGALAIAERSGDAALAAWARFFLGQVHRSRGELREALACYAASVHPSGGDGFADPSVRLASPAIMSLTFQGVTYAGLGQFDDALSLGRAALQAAETSGRPYDLAYACYGLGGTLHIQGDFTHASVVLERGLALHSSHHLKEPVGIGPLLGCVYTKLGRNDEGLRLAEETVEAAIVSRARGRAFFLLRLGEAYMDCGRISDAEAVIERALELAVAHGERGNEVYALILAGRVRTFRQRPDVERVEQHYRQAMDICEEQGRRPQLAHCHLGLGTLYGRTGQHQMAKEHLALAATMYREMDMRYWLEQTDLKESGAASVR